MTPIIRLTECGSTNAEAMARARADAVMPFWLTTERQSHGRGRSGRVWQMEPGNLAASYATRLTCDLATASQLSLVVGVAVYDAICALAHGQAGDLKQKLRLKWPNDILMGQAKCGGILIETTSDPQTGTLVAVIGIGLNIVCHPTIVDRDCTNLHAEGLQTTVDAALGCVAQALDAALAVWDGGNGMSGIRQKWAAASLPVGYGTRCDQRSF
jgi:BirA family transcriptional regulator, biotin operon repressor / biotin---[acetyl-CoA-carboxylase] ligase